VLIPPTGAGDQPNGDEEEQQPNENPGHFEHQQEQNNSDQHRSHRRQIARAEMAEKIPDFVEVHGFLEVMAKPPGGIHVRDVFRLIVSTVNSRAVPRGNGPVDLWPFILSLAHKSSCGKLATYFVFWQSARGLAHSKTLRVFQESSCRAQRLGVRRPSAAFPRDISNRAQVNWDC
jgi:hypothetical protein